MSDENKSSYAKLAGTIGATILVIVIIMSIFAENQFNTVVPIVWALVILGIILGFFQYKENRPQEIKKK